MRPVAITGLPGFTESLRLLVEREKYSLLDIGLMFGVTRERVRVLCVQRGIVTPPKGAVSGRAARVVREWDDDRHCFRPVRTTGRAAMLRAVLAFDRLDLRQHVRDGYRAHIVAAVASLRDRPRVTYADAWFAISGRARSGGALPTPLLAAWRACHKGNTITWPRMRETLASETGVRWAHRGNWVRG